jgi:hypothetical protein
LDERAALKLRNVLAQCEAERNELWRQVYGDSCQHESLAATMLLLEMSPAQPAVLSFTVTHNADVSPMFLQGLEIKRHLHQSVKQQYDTEKSKYITVQQLNKAQVIKQLNGGRGNMPYRNLRMG